MADNLNVLVEKARNANIAFNVGEVEGISNYINTLVNIIALVEMRNIVPMKEEEQTDIYKNMKIMSEYNSVVVSIECIKKQTKQKHQKEQLKQLVARKESLEEDYRMAYTFFDESIQEEQSRAV